MELIKALESSGLQQLIGDSEANEFFQTKCNPYAGIKKRDLMQIYLSQKGECALCGDALIYNTQKTHVDHIVPRAQGGKDEVDNLELVCACCNYAKRDMSLKDFVLMCTKVQNVYYRTDILPEDVVQKILQKRWARESSNGCPRRKTKKQRRRREQFTQLRLDKSVRFNRCEAV